MACGGTVSLGALVVCGVAWLVTAATLVLDLLGRLPARLKRNGGIQRPQRVAGLAVITGVILTEVGELGSWPRALRTSLDLTDVLLALILIVSVLAAQSPRRRAESRSDA
jgi:hypothetical protein